MERPRQKQGTFQALDTIRVLRQDIFRAAQEQCYSAVLFLNSYIFRARYFLILSNLSKKLQQKYMDRIANWFLATVPSCPSPQWPSSACAPRTSARRAPAPDPWYCNVGEYGRITVAACSRIFKKPILVASFSQCVSPSNSFLIFKSLLLIHTIS